MLASHGTTQGLTVSHNDIGAARAWMAEICGPHSLRMGASAPLAFKHSAGRLAGLSTVLGRIEYGADVEIGVDAGSLKSYSISLPLCGEQHVRQGRALVHSDARTGLIVSPFEHQQLSMAADCRKLQVVVTCEAMNQVLEQMLRRPVQTPVVFQTRIDAEHGASAAWWRMVHYLVAEMEQPTPLLSQRVLARDLERTLIKSLLMSQPHNHSGLLELESDESTPVFVQNARRFMEAHAQDEIELADIQREAGVSAQRLHDGFKLHVGCTPLAYLKRLRLDAVRASLQEPRGTCNVATTAMRWGFMHLGRFASDYRQAFGEPPSQTLARARRRESPARL